MKEKASNRKFSLVFQHGCTRRKMDLDIISKYFRDNGWLSTENEKEADVIVISTCAYDQSHEQEAVDLVRTYAEGRKSSCRLIVAGCLGSINEQRIDNIRGLAIVPPKALSRLDELIEPSLPIGHISDLSVMMEDVDYPLQRTDETAFRHMVGTSKPSYEALPPGTPMSLYDPRNKLIRIARGCMGRCSYCAIRFATGKLISKALGEIVKEVRFGVGNGFRQITLVAEDVGCYGMDSGTNFVHLLNKVLHCSDDCQVQLHAINIQWIKKYSGEFGELLKQNPGRISAIFCPIQSASNRILELMERDYTIENARECFQLIRKVDANIKIITDIMVGFPGETQSDFEKAVAFLGSFDFDNVQVFKFNSKKNTKAERLPNQVGEKLKNARYRLLQLACSIRQKKLIMGYRKFGERISVKAPGPKTT